jgi:hypothetical protein
MSSSLPSRSRIAILGCLAVVLVMSTVIGGLASGAGTHNIDERRPSLAQHTQTEMSSISAKKDKKDESKKNKTKDDFPTLPAPKKTMGSTFFVTTIYEKGALDDGESSKDEIYAFRVGVTKLNKTTFVITHTHGDITKRWFTPNSSIWEKNGVYSDMKGWSGRLKMERGDDKHDQLVDQVIHTPVWQNKIIPFARDVHAKKSGKGFPYPNKRVVIGTVTLDVIHTPTGGGEDESVIITKVDRPKTDRFVIRYEYGNNTKKWTIKNSTITMRNGQTGMSVDFAGDEDEDAEGKVFWALSHHPVWQKINPFVHQQNKKEEKKEGTPLSSFIPSLIKAKWKQLAAMFANSFEWLFDKIYTLTIGTPVPQNTGWHGIFGTPTNQPFKSLYTTLLSNILYPIMNYVLGLGILFLGLSFMVNPFLSTHRIWNLLIKFVTALMLYAFSWIAVTILHKGAATMTSFIAPNPAVVTQSASNLLAFGAAVPVAAYVGGALIGFGSVLELAVVFGLRQTALRLIFPYIFGPLVLILYLSPWQYLKKVAHKAIWQYINLLTMSIPIAILLRAAVAVKWSFGFSGFLATVGILGLFLLMAIYPVVSTYLFFQMSGHIGSVASAATSGAATRVGSATEKMGWGRDSASDTSATSGSTPSTRAQAMSDAQEQLTLSSSATARTHRAGDDSSTTASKIREQYTQQQTGPMSPTKLKAAAFERFSDNGGEKRATMAERRDTDHSNQ